VAVVRWKVISGFEIERRGYPFISPAGSGLSVTQRKILEAAKGELRKLFGKDKTTRDRVSS
jgi:hypothetical protein